MTFQKQARLQRLRRMSVGRSASVSGFALTGIWFAVRLALRVEKARFFRKERTMSRCETCGNEYEKTFEVILNGESHTFDSFECAIHRLAPPCAHCGCRV